MTFVRESRWKRGHDQQVGLLPDGVLDLADLLGGVGLSVENPKLHVGLLRPQLPPQLVLRRAIRLAEVALAEDDQLLVFFSAPNARPALTAATPNHARVLDMTVPPLRPLSDAAGKRAPE